MWIIEPPMRNNDEWYLKLDNALDSSLLELLDSYVEENKEIISPARVMADSLNTPDVRRTDVLFLTDHNRLDNLYRKLTELVVNVNNSYYKYSISFLENLQYSIYRSEVEGFYTTHTDSGLKGNGGMCRKLSFSLLLNDTTEFEGGQFIMNNFGEGNNLKLEKNQIVFFPSFMPHTVTPVTRGVRKSLVGWVQGPNFV